MGTGVGGARKPRHDEIKWAALREVQYVYLQGFLLREVNLYVEIITLALTSLVEGLE